MPDDDFGGPLPDDAHFTGVVLRLDDDGRTPRDNPFFFGFGRHGDVELRRAADTIGRLGVKWSATSSARSPTASATASA